MDATTALQTFLAGTLVRKRDRYIGFVAKPKTQAKFLNAICHDLEAELDSAKEIAKLPPSNSPRNGFCFAPPDEFGVPVDDLQEAVESPFDCFLVVSVDGRFGIHSPESWIDSRKIYRI